jgi:hypothetical protein
MYINECSGGRRTQAERRAATRRALLDAARGLFAERGYHGTAAEGIVRRAFDVDEYHRMAEVGILSEDDRVELLEGEIAEMSPIGSRHQGCVNWLARLLFEFAGRDYVVHVQGPVRLNERSEPQPDLALLKPRPDFYSEGHSTPRMCCCSSRSRSPRRTTAVR